jgi:putative transposase
MDFLVVSTVRFNMLYVWFAIDHARQEILHFNVMAYPISAWVIQQLREGFPGDTSVRFLVHDNDEIFSRSLRDSIAQLGIESRPSSIASPWQNGLAEPWVGTVRRELLDHVVVMDERHLRRLLRDYVEYYNKARVHTYLRDSPAGRANKFRPSRNAQVHGIPLVGGLHHRYAWRDAA